MSTHLNLCDQKNKLLCVFVVYFPLYPMYNVALILIQTFRVNVIKYGGREGLNGDIYILKNSANIVIRAQRLREHYSIFNT
jgi:hypothetical protein